MKTLMFSDCVQKYLLNYLPLQKGASENTRAAYSRSYLEFYAFCNIKLGIRPAKLDFKDINRHLIEEFCVWLEDTKNNTAQTRNLRLSAIHSLFRYIELECPEYVPICRDVLSVSMKKTLVKPPSYLTKDEMKQLLAQPNTNSMSGRRDLSILMTLYDAALRAEELLALRVGDVFLNSAPTIKVTGKGNKQRIVPITKVTAEALRSYIKDNGLSQKPDYVLFTNSSGNALTRMGITYILKKYAKSAELPMIYIPGGKISPHVIRRSKATHLVQSGVNIYYIRDFLGHVSIAKTERYLRNDPETTRKSIEKASLSLVIDDNCYTKSQKENMIDFLRTFQKHK
ncbi:MAG TPA: tyrosine-type recombinase/integrase [Clostridium sp.]|nr:tyrosine-type recombinase/integrase [Clostridium sp.]